jgi:uncharacterized protein (DUF302 family)
VITTKESPRSVDETVERLKGVIAAKGLTLFAAVDHSGEAEAAGLALRNTKVVIFGSPTAGTPVMQAHALAALDLPLKVLVWDEDGETRLAYTSPAALAARYELDEQLAAGLAGIDAVTDAAIAGRRRSTSASRDELEANRQPHRAQLSVARTGDRAMAVWAAGRTRPKE